MNKINKMLGQSLVFPILIHTCLKKTWKKVLIRGGPGCNIFMPNLDCLRNRITQMRYVLFYLQWNSVITNRPFLFVITGLICVVKGPIYPKNLLVITECSLTTEFHCIFKMWRTGIFIRHCSNGEWTNTVGHRWSCA